RLADRHQAARHQRRRFFQRQLRASLREPDAAREFPRSAGHSDDPGRALLHVRLHGPTRARGQRGLVVAKQGVDHAASALQAGGNMEGKEVRFGIANSALWATATTAASNGSVNAMHDSFTPIGGLVPMWLIQLGEVIYGGVGSGLYGMLMFAIIAVFVAGLMVGRTPEYLGKKIEAYEMK